MSHTRFDEVADALTRLYQEREVLEMASGDHSARLAQIHIEQTALDAELAGIEKGRR